MQFLSKILYYLKTDEPSTEKVFVDFIALAILSILAVWGGIKLILLFDN